MGTEIKMSWLNVMNGRGAEWCELWETSQSLGILAPLRQDLADEV